MKSIISTITSISNHVLFMKKSSVYYRVWLRICSRKSSVTSKLIGSFQPFEPEISRHILIARDSATGGAEGSSASAAATPL